MKSHLHRLTLLAAVAALTTGLAACNKTEEQTAGQKLDSAIAKTEDAARDVQASAANAANEAKDAAARAGDQLKDSASRMSADASAAASRVAESAGDAAITASVSAGLLKDPDLSAIKIDVTTKDGVVSLSGPALPPPPRSALKPSPKALQGSRKSGTIWM